MDIYLEKKMERLNSGEYRNIVGTNLSTLNIGLTKCGRAKWQEAETTRKDIQYCTDPSGQEILYLRALQGHSGRNPIDPTLQDNVLILGNFFEYIYHIGCAINLHPITNSGLMAERTKFKQGKTDRTSILYVEQAVYRPSTPCPWCLFHVFCLCHAKRGLVKSSLYGSLCSLSMGFTAVKNTIKQDVMQSSFTIHSQLIVSRKLL